MSQINYCQLYENNFCYLKCTHITIRLTVNYNGLRFLRDFVFNYPLNVLKN